MLKNIILNSLSFHLIAHALTFGPDPSAHLYRWKVDRPPHREIGFNKSAICNFLSFNSGGMSVFGDFAVPMSFPRERDPGTGTKNKIVTDWQLSVMRIQMNTNPSMTA